MSEGLIYTHPTQSVKPIQDNPNRAGAESLHSTRRSMADATTDSISGATSDISDLLLPMRMPLGRLPEAELYCFGFQG